jgi:NOL1/NOP2/sun family putative RNA methylase
MIERYIQFLGLKQTKNLLIANEKPLIPSIRVNTLKIEPNRLMVKLENKGFNLEPTKWFPYAFMVKDAPHNIGATHEFLQGYYYIQNLASMACAPILAPQEDEVVVDMCAAPGSKATHLAQIMKNSGTLILIDYNLKRIPALEINLRRLGILNSVVMNFDSKELPKLNVKADKILLDSPCTGEGLIRQDPARKKSKKLNDIEKMAQIQKLLLQSGLKTLKVGGKLLYSTCSIAPEENELIIDSVLNKMKGYEIVKIPHQYGVDGFTEVYGKILIDELRFSQRIYPHIHDTIGFFFCLIEKK